MSASANMKSLEGLHALVAEVLTNALKSEEVVPAVIAQAIKFLKDNGVEPAKDVDNSVLNELSDAVQSFMDGEGDVPEHLQN